MLPALRFYADGQEHSSHEVTDALAIQLNLTEQELKEMLPSGQQEIFDNRVGWARSYIKKAGLIESTRRGYNKITRRGREVLAEDPKAIDLRYLFRGAASSNGNIEPSADQSTKTPEESLELAYQKIRGDLASDLLQRLKACSPGFFERLVVEVIVKMGYGGSRQDAGKAIGKSGDGGIDGMIKEDKLGLDAIFIQAKRWENTVGRPEIQKFVGALTGQRAKKGLFITTADFSAEAEDYVSRIDTKIVLIDGETLAQLMIDNGVGVSTVAAYELKKVDTDYFAEE